MIQCITRKLFAFCMFSRQKKPQIRGSHLRICQPHVAEKCVMYWTCCTHECIICEICGNLRRSLIKGSPNVYNYPPLQIPPFRIIFRPLYTKTTTTDIMQFDFTDAMKKASDTELIKIVTIDRADYQDAALKAAEAELAARNLHISTIETAKKHIEQTHKAAAEKAALPLEIHWKILAFILPFVFIFLMSGIFKAEGYERKANELAKWAFIGFGFYVLITIYIILEQAS